MKQKILEFLKAPTILVSGLTALIVVFGAFGFEFRTPASLIAEHESEYIAGETAQNIRINSLENVMTEQLELVKALVRAECIRETAENLQRAGIMDKCIELGIDKR